MEDRVRHERGNTTRRYNLLRQDNCVKEGSSDDFKNWLGVLNLSRQLNMAVWVCVGMFWSDLKPFTSRLDLHGAALKTRSENFLVYTLQALNLNWMGFLRI